MNSVIRMKKHSTQWYPINLKLPLSLTSSISLDEQAVPRISGNGSSSVSDATALRDLVTASNCPLSSLVDFPLLPSLLPSLVTPLPGRETSETVSRLRPSPRTPRGSEVVAMEAPGVGLVAIGRRGPVSSSELLEDSKRGRGERGLEIFEPVFGER